MEIKVENKLEEKLINDQNEIYDFVDKLDRVVGTATRREIHKRKLMHRSIHILVFNSSKEIFLQKRSMAKSGKLDWDEYILKPVKIYFLTAIFSE